MRIAKYLLLIVLALLALYVIAPYGDRCSGMAHALAWFFFAGLYSIIFLVLLFRDLHAYSSMKRRFDFIPIAITCTFCFVNIAFWRSENILPWPGKAFDGGVDLSSRHASLILYTNGTFTARNMYADWTCTYVGDYRLNRDTLVLLRTDLIERTDSAFATRYLLNSTNGALVPIEKGFEPIQRYTPAP